MRHQRDEDDLTEGRDFYGFDFGDYRDFEGRDPDADYGGRGPARSGERGSDIRGYQGAEHRNYDGGYEGYYEEGGPLEYESWRWSSREDWEPVSQWSSRHSHEFEHPGVIIRRRRSRHAHSLRRTAPKGYLRSDSSIYEDVCALLEDADVDPSDVTVSVDDREVMLSGTVDDRWSKRYVEDLAYSVRGVSDVINNLRVEPR